MSDPLQQLELDLEYPPEPRSVRVRKGAAGIFVGALSWTPVLLPFVLFTQIALLGLEPALDERARLEVESTRLAGQLADLEAERQELTRRSCALEDPIFRERVRRARRTEVVPGSFRPLALPLSSARPTGTPGLTGLPR